MEKDLFDYPLIVEAISNEAKAIVEKLRASSNPGMDWEQWKQRMKYFLQSIQKKIKRDEICDINKAKSHLEKFQKNTDHRIQRK